MTPAISDIVDVRFVPTMSDIAALRDLVSRCSPRTLSLRFQSHSPTAADCYIRAVATGDMQITRAAWIGSRMVGLGSILLDRRGNEFALLVEDSWQRRGIGYRLGGLLCTIAASHDLDYVRFQIAAQNRRARRLVEQLCPHATFGMPQAGVVEGSVPLQGFTAIGSGFADPLDESGAAAIATDRAPVRHDHTTGH